jgi:arabinofuranan 3-O-arabinosyltransferase
MALVGTVVALKPSLAPLLLLPVALRRWRPALAAWGAAAGASLLGVLVAGPATGLQWLRIGLTEPVPDTADNASLPGVAVRLGLPSAVGTALGLVVLAVTLAVLHRRRAQVDPAGTAPWAVLAAGLLLSPIAWHNYLMLLWPGLLVLLARGPRWRPGRVAVLLAVAVVPVSWNALWPPGEWWALPGRCLYCLVLIAYWWVLLRESDPSDPGSSRGPRVADGTSPAGSPASAPPTATGSSVTPDADPGSSTTASGAPGARSSVGGSSS